MGIRQPPICPDGPAPQGHGCPQRRARCGALLQIIDGRLSANLGEHPYGAIAIVALLAHADGFSLPLGGFGQTHLVAWAPGAVQLPAACIRPRAHLLFAEDLQLARHPASPHTTLGNLPYGLGSSVLLLLCFAHLVFSAMFYNGPDSSSHLGIDWCSLRRAHCSPSFRSDKKTKLTATPCCVRVGWPYAPPS